MTLKKRKRALGVSEQTTAGTPVNPGDSDVTLMVVDPIMAAEPKVFVRTVVSKSLTPKPNTASGGTPGTVTFGVELAGHPDNPADIADWTEPNLGPLLRACGYVGFNVREIPHGAITDGPFQHGETVTQATSSATGIVVGDVFDSYSGRTYVRGETGTWDGTNAFTGGTSTASATASAVVTNARWAWFPTSTFPTTGISADGSDPALLTLELDVDGKHYQVQDCRGTVSFAFTHGEAVILNFTMQGIVVEYIDGGFTVASINFEQEDPPSWLNIAATLSDGTDTLSLANGFCFNSMTADTAIEVVVRECSTTVSGFDAADIVNRDGTMSMNPDEVLNTTYDFVDAFRFATQAHMEHTTGGTIGNQFLFRMPGLVTTGLTDTDRDGIFVWDGTWQLSGGTYTTTAASNTGDIGEENELIIIAL